MSDWLISCNNVIDKNRYEPVDFANEKSFNAQIQILLLGHFPLVNLEDEEEQAQAGK